MKLSWGQCHHGMHADLMPRSGRSLQLVRNIEICDSCDELIILQSLHDSLCFLVQQNTKSAAFNRHQIDQRWPAVLQPARLSSPKTNIEWCWMMNVHEFSIIFIVFSTILNSFSSWTITYSHSLFSKIFTCSSSRLLFLTWVAAQSSWTGTGWHRPGFSGEDFRDSFCSGPMEPNWTC